MHLGLMPHHEKQVESDLKEDTLVLGTEDAVRSLYVSGLVLHEAWQQL